MILELLPYAGAAVAALTGALWLYLRGRSDGERAERARQAERIIHAAETRAKADAAVGGLPDDELDDWLRPPEQRR